VAPLVTTAVLVTAAATCVGVKKLDSPRLQPAKVNKCLDAGHLVLQDAVADENILAQ